MGALDPPPWSAVGGLLEHAALLYAVLFAIAVVVSFSHRSSSVRFMRELVLQWKAITAFYLIIVQILSFSAVYAFALAIMRIFFSTLVCVTYVYVTYMGYIPWGVRLFQGTLGLALLAQFIFSLLFVPSPIAFMMHVETFMEVLSLMSLLLSSGKMWLNFSFLQAFIVLSRYFSVEPVLEAMMVRKTSPFRRQLARLAMEFVVFIYVFACGLQLFEVLGDPLESLTATTFELTLANSLYFTVVTIFTVGYGDFVPYTLLGRLWIIFIIVFGAYLVSRKIGQVIDVVSGLRRGMGSFVKDEDVEHCVLCGNVKWEYLKSFVQEFYADVNNEDTKIVVICEQPNWTEELWNTFFSSDDQFKDNVVYLEGACMSRDDLMRAQVETASAVFVLNNQHDPKPYVEDSETLKRILTVRAFSPNLPIYSMCALRDSMLQITVALEHDEDAEDVQLMRGPMAGSQARSGSLNMSALEAGVNNSLGDGSLNRDDVNTSSILGEGGIGISGEGVRSSSLGDGSVLGTNALRPAFSMDFSDDDDDDDFMVVSDYDWKTEMKSDAICMQEVEMSLLAENVFCNGLTTLLSNLVLNVVPQSKPTDRPWMVEYKIGAECRLAYVKLPMELHGKRFADLAITLYDYGILLLATKRFSDVKWRTITPDTLIHLNTIGLVVTFHSANFIDTVMQHAARYVLDNEGKSMASSDMDVSSRGVPSVDDDAGFQSDMMTGGVDIDVPSAIPGPEVDPDDLGTGGWPAVEENLADPEDGSGPEGEGDAGQSQDVHHLVGRGHSDLEADPFFPFLPGPNVRTQNIGVVGSAAEGARLSDSGDDSRSSREVVQGTNLPGAFVPALGLPQAASVRSASVDNMARIAVDGAGSAMDSPDDLDSLADTYVAEQSLPPVRNSPSTAPNDPMLSAGAKDFSRKGSASSSALEARLGALGPSIADTVRASKVSFDGLAKPKRRHSAHGSARFRESPKPGLPVKDGNETARGAERVFFGDAALPIRLKGHIVVCVIGQMGLVNLKHFLHRVWMRRRGFKRETPVVAICPKITEGIEDDIAVFAKNKLYVMQGNSLNIATLRRAQFDRARAIVVLACEDKNDVGHMDAKALFTVMTLDYMLGERSNTFVCTMIDAEESMQLLRAPAHPRRRGAYLGKSAEEYSYGRGGRSPRPERSLGSSGSFLATTTPPSQPANFVDGNGISTNSAEFPPSPLLRIPETWNVPDSSPGHLHASFTGSNVLARGDTATSLGANSMASLMDGPGPDGPPSPRVEACSLSIGEPHLSGAAMRLPRLRTSRTVSFLGIPEQMAGPLVDLPHRAFTSSIGAGSNFLYPSASFGASALPPSASALPGGMPPRSAGFPTMAPASSVFPPMPPAFPGSGLPGMCGGANFDQEGSMPFAGEQASQPLGNGASKKRSRDELFERQRYASGEMMISSVYVALLIREFAMPGIMSVVRKIFGAGVGKNAKSKKCWIRTIKIPASWIASGEGGQRTYRELFQVLLELSCVPLGLYRSGEATIRVQFHNDRDAADDDDEESPLLGDDGMGPFKTYTCPTRGHTARFEEVPGGENVLPYVYTNPEPYTLISEHDAVYILAHPLLKIPDVWDV